MYAQLKKFYTLATNTSRTSAKQKDLNCFVLQPASSKDGSKPPRAGGRDYKQRSGSSRQIDCCGGSGYGGGYKKRNDNRRDNYRSNNRHSGRGHRVIAAIAAAMLVMTVGATLVPALALVAEIATVLVLTPAMIPLLIPHTVDAEEIPLPRMAIVVLSQIVPPRGLCLLES